jgi:uncharacterized membrane protein YfcA
LRATSRRFLPSLSVPAGANRRRFAQAAALRYIRLNITRSIRTLGTESDILLAGLIFVAAALYSSVGHAGASGYLAAMALFGLPQAVMRPTALVLNILVATVATARFAKAGYFRWKSFWPYAAASVPLAFVGGGISIPGNVYRVLIGVVLIWSAFMLVWRSRSVEGQPNPQPPIWTRLGIGGGIGLLSGLTGVGGGIFLSPVILLKRWELTKTTSGIASAFILSNSVAGLAGQLSATVSLPPALPMWAGAALVGGWIGSTLGSRWLNVPAIQRLLALVLLVAGLKLALT